MKFIEIMMFNMMSCDVRRLHGPHRRGCQLDPSREALQGLSGSQVAGFDGHQIAPGAHELSATQCLGVRPLGCPMPACWSLSA